MEMEEPTVLRKDQLEISFHKEKKLIQEGTIKDDNPLDLSEPFRDLCSACRKGDLKVCQEKITEGVNVNARDLYDYTPLILDGHWNTPLVMRRVDHCKRRGLTKISLLHCRCLYNALNDRIRNLLLEYDYSKSTDPLQPLAAHIASLLTRDSPITTDIVVTSNDESIHLHKFILAARSPYFKGKLSTAPDSTAWNIPSHIPPQAFSAAIRYLYLGEAPRELRGGPGTGFTETEVFAGIDRIAKYLEIETLVDSILESGDRRLARQRRTLELSKGRDQLENWFRTNVLGNKIVVETSKAGEVKWDHDNHIFADVLLRADELPEDAEDAGTADGQQKSTLFPCHRAMLLRSEFFQAMFTSSFREAHVTDNLHIIDVDCSPEVLEIILTFLYTERADFPLDVAVDVLFAADMLFIEKLKTKAAVVISTLGSGGLSQEEAARTRGDVDEDDIDVYAIMRAAWLTRVQRLEEFAARYLAYRLEAHIDSADFAELIQESASRIQVRQETDTIELLDDIRFYLNERFRLRFDDAGLDEMLNGQQAPPADAAKEITEITDRVDALNVSRSVEQPVEADGHREIRTLDGAIVEDEFSEDAMNYEILMEKLDALLENLNLEA
ncbi:hypothetical protein N7509_013737 [Penicillium cosmopolitanum]|uniref:BTB domain-containing protein n=1 Tax=Penicillium cosmopolitanum TaxID=1131564 RepID=A0A9W9SDY1_9EURO|nr:uncharacterized protein N7509_013737 [Penicillium cosmopolitanum]KAJ5376851.1 hypothetical protein N7509_013737 [Penicillium cosmopolitanum]